MIAEQYDVKVSVNDIIIKVVATALKNVPEANGKYFYCISQSIFIAYNCLGVVGIPIIKYSFNSFEFPSLFIVHQFLTNDIILFLKYRKQ